MNGGPVLPTVDCLPWQVVGARVDRIGIVRIDRNRIEIAQVFVFLRGDASPVFSRVRRAIHAIGSARYENVRVGRRFGNSTNYKPLKTNELPSVAGVSAAVNAP